MQRSAVLALLGLVVATGFGCSTRSTPEAGSGSGSDPSRSAWRSSAASSGATSPSSRAAPYPQDVRDYTSQWMLSGGDPAAFRAGIAPIAEQHGITDYESDLLTWVGIGSGLRKSGVTGARYDRVRKLLAAGSAEAPTWIDEGYGR